MNPIKLVFKLNFVPSYEIYAGLDQICSELLDGIEVDGWSADNQWTRMFPIVESHRFFGIGKKDGSSFLYLEQDRVDDLADANEMIKLIVQKFAENKTKQPTFLDFIYRHVYAVDLKLSFGTIKSRLMTHSYSDEARELLSPGEVSDLAFNINFTEGSALHRVKAGPMTIDQFREMQYFNKGINHHFKVSDEVAEEMLYIDFDSLHDNVEMDSFPKEIDDNSRRAKKFAKDLTLRIKKGITR